MPAPTSSRAPMAGGFLLAIAVLTGTFVGASRGQPSIGAVAGFGIGLAAAILVWLIDRMRKG
jgi:hypothetical protein